MAYSALLEFIQKAKAYDALDADIIDRLMKAGWYRIDAQDALALYEKLFVATALTGVREQTTIPRPSFIERVAPLHYEPHIIAVAALVFSFAFVGYLVLGH